MRTHVGKMSSSPSKATKVPVVVSCGKKRLRARVLPSKLTLPTLTRVAAKHFNGLLKPGLPAPASFRFVAFNKLNGRRRKIKTQAQLDRLKSKLAQHAGHLQADAAETICAEPRCISPEHTLAANLACATVSQKEPWVYIGIVGLAAVQAASDLADSASKRDDRDADGDSVEDSADEDAAWVCALVDLFDALVGAGLISTDELTGAPADMARAVQLVRGPPEKWDAAAVSEAADATAEAIDDFLATAGAPSQYNVSLFKEYLDEKEFWVNSSESAPFLSAEYSGLFPAFFGLH